MSDRDEWAKIQREGVPKPVVLARTDCGGEKPDDWSAGIERAIRRQAAAATAAPEAAASEATAPASASAGAGAAQHPPTSSPAPVTLSKSAPVAPTSAPVAASAALEDVTALAIPSCDLRCLGLPPSGAGRLVSLDLADNRLTAKEVDSLPRTAPWLRVLDITANHVSAALTALPPKLLSLSLAHNRLGSVEGPLVPPSQCLRSLSLERCGLRTIVDAGGRSRFGSLPALLVLNLRQNELKDPAELASLAEVKRLEDLSIAGNPWEAEDSFPEAWTAAKKRLPCLKRVDAQSHTVRISSSGDAVAEAASRSAGAQLGEDSASCSCKEGNPCAVSYNCMDWERRFEVAQTARKERYDLVFYPTAEFRRL